MPDALANKIAAGEVVQRPASVVKEILENAIDAGADAIDVVITDAGKTLIQIIDNGSGMTNIDARMAFERHATSKIKNIEDLNSIKTMGFRGEALASIASVSQVMLKTRVGEDELGTEIEIHGSKVQRQDPCATPVGTNIAIKHLFYNVPARRKFLKSDATEFKNILDEFNRAALARPDIRFRLIRDGQEIYHLPPGTLRQRIVGLFDKKINDKIMPLEQDMDWVKLSGFIGRPEIAKRRRGEQYFFVNERFIKSPYLFHAVKNGFDNLLAEDTHPFFVVKLEMDPSRVDVNVHPTKHEVKFQEETVLYNFIKVAVKHTLGTYALTPMIDFDSPKISFENLPKKPTQSEISQWQDLYRDKENLKKSPETTTLESKVNKDESILLESQSKAPVQIHRSYILQQIKSGLLMIDQSSAHERILYERHLAMFETGEVSSQKELFPKVVHLPSGDLNLLQSIMAEITCLGFEVENFGEDSIIIHGTPAHLSELSLDPEKVLIELLEQFKENQELKLGVKENVARSLASRCSIRKGQSLEIEQMNEIIDALFACENPYKSPLGRQCFVVMDHEELERRFSK
ncbi:MAG: DNA mismatch repair endonuclease MutL [Saprospiraceae bacterium]|nr:DNA mismatch repair endonuclease MutL [Saprospiraceae bacterium]